MQLIKWDDNFSVKVKEIDEQHKKLVEMINALHDAMSEGKSKEILSDIIQKMIEYTDFHFKTEEKYFDKFDYPDSKKHKAEHINFVQKVTEFHDGYKSGKVFLSIEVMDFLKNWLHSHITGSDKNYTSFFNSKGLY